MIKRPGTAAVALILVGIFLVMLAPKLYRLYRLSERSGKLDLELRQLRLQNQRLESEIRLLREDPVYLEKVAREKFNKAKQGEIVYKVVRE
jgi:cell division protein FtsB